MATVTFSNLDLGYYLVDSSLGALCGLNTTNPNATIKEKNEKPDNQEGSPDQAPVIPGAANNNAKIGDTVEYKVEIKVADGAQKYTVTDTMSKGLTFNNSSLKVTANDAVTTDYTLTSTTNGFTLVLPETYVSNLTKGTTIIVTYNATLNKDAVIDGDGNANEVTLSYGNHQNTVPSKVTTKSYQFDLVKVDGTTNKLLDGAEFELADGNTKLSFVKDDCRQLPCGCRWRGWCNHYHHRQGRQGQHLRSGRQNLYPDRNQGSGRLQQAGNPRNRKPDRGLQGFMPPSIADDL